MEKRFLAIVLIIAGLCACEKRGGPSDRAASLNVKVRIGVVMKSGDVKRVARRDALVMKADIIALWADFEMSKSREHSQIEREIKQEIGYDAKLNSIQNSMNQLRTSIDNLLAQGHKQLREHVEKTYQDAKDCTYSEYYRYFDKFRYEPSERGEAEYRRNLEDTYTLLINTDPFSKEYLTERRVELKKISSLFDETVPQKKRDLNQFANEQREFIDTFNSTVSERERNRLEKAKTEFLQKVREALVLSFKTDLEGEASVAMPKGRYFLFCDADVGLSHITWNYPVEVKQEGQSIELSNDNAAPISEGEVAQLISTIGSSGTK